MYIVDIKAVGNFFFRIALMHSPFAIYWSSLNRENAASCSDSCLKDLNLA